MSFLNTLNAGFLIFASVWFYLETYSKPCVENDGVESSGCMNNADFVAGIYVCSFSSMLLCFELHCSRFDKTLVRWVGFMFSWGGRIAFLLFTGVLAFQLGDLGIAAGITTCVNCIFNYYVMGHNINYRMYIKAKCREAKYNAEMANMGGASGVAMQAMQPSGSAQVGGSDPSGGFPGSNEVAAKPAGNPTGPDWERFHDEESGSYYYYNHKTKVTQWEAQA